MAFFKQTWAMHPNDSVQLELILKFILWNYINTFPYTLDTEKH